MNEVEFSKLSKDLIRLGPQIPLSWGKIQNNRTDAKLNLFDIGSYDDLEAKITMFKDVDKQYFRMRWYIWQSSRCDEHLFCTNGNVSPNPNQRDQTYDIEFNGNPILRFDLKGTVVPKSFRGSGTDLFSERTISEITAFYYERQSKGIRYKIQNRLFVIHHSQVNEERTLQLRSRFELKSKAFRAYSEMIKTGRKFIAHRNVICDAIIIFENKNREEGYFFIK